MIVVFVIDNSPSMGLPASGESGMSRLDLAKMAVEDLCRQLRKRQAQHVKLIQEDPSAETQRSYLNLGLGSSHPDQLLLLSTARQYPDSAACAAGGRLLVGFGSSSSVAMRSTFINNNDPNNPNPRQSTDQSDAGDAAAAAAAASMDDHHMMEAFHRQLKGLKAASWDVNSGKPFPEEAGGATGLNIALSAGLQLLSRYRLQSSYTENFGLGRLTNPSIFTGTNVPATGALQPASLIVVTDGAALRQPPKLGGGSLQLQYGAQPLREFYTEPFRWDQRIFCLGVGGKEGIASTQYLHPQLRALCEVTGGSHWMIRKAVASNLSQMMDAVLKRMSPPLPREIPLADPLFKNTPLPTHTPRPVKTMPGLSFIHGGPIVALQALEADEAEGGQHRPSKARRAVLLYTSSTSTAVSVGSSSPASPSSPENSKFILSPPLWCIPEAHFPSKKLDTLPPRKAQPHLFFSRYPANLGSKSFEPGQVIKLLQKLDSLTTANRKNITTPQLKCLQRDTYICEWISSEGGKPVQVTMQGRQEYFPVFCPGAGRPSLSGEESDSYLNIGILHVPAIGSNTLAATANPSRLATLTLLPPDPHILLPLLVRAAEAEHRVMKKLEGKGSLGKGVSMAKINVPLDENWRNEIRAYLFRLPPYYQPALKRALRPILPASANNLLNLDTTSEGMVLQCFSKVCLQKIRNGEQIAKDNNDRLERQEMSLRNKHGTIPFVQRPDEKPPVLRYGQYDPRGTVDSYLAALRNMPPPWRAGAAVSQQRKEGKPSDSRFSDTASNRAGEQGEDSSPRSVLDLLGDLPKEGLMSYYESRRRWIFGGTGLTTRGMHVEGVNYDGSNSQKCDGTPGEQPQSPLSLAGVGVSTVNQTTTTRMGDYRERLLFSKPPIVGYGSNDYAGVAATTGVDGSPKWSVDDDAMPLAFFNPVTGEFQDSVQARVRSRLMVNFGNPYKEKRADSLIPEKYSSQTPSNARGVPESVSGSPPHDSFDSVEEGEAVFVLKSPSRTSPKREEPDDVSLETPPSKKPKIEETGAPSASKGDEKPPPPPPQIEDNAKVLKPPPPKPLPPPPKPPPALAIKPPPVGATQAQPTPNANIPPPPPPSTTLPPKPPKPAIPKSGPPPPLKQGTPHRPSASKRPAPPKPPPKGGARPPPPKPSSTMAAPPPPPAQVAAPGSLPPAQIATLVPLVLGQVAAPTHTASAQVVSPAPLPSSQMAVTEPAPPAQVVAPVSTLESDEFMAARKSQNTAIPVPPLDLQRADIKPEVDLPAGWICVWSKSQKRWYFFNTKNNQSVWEWPPPI